MIPVASSPPDPTFAPAERRLLREYVLAHGVPQAWPQLAGGFTRYARGAAVSAGELAALCLKLMSLSDQEIVRLLESSRWGDSIRIDAPARGCRFAA